MDTLGPTNNNPVGDRRAGPDASSIDWESFESRSRRDLESLLKEDQQVSPAIVQKLSRDIKLFRKLLLIPEEISVSDHVIGLLNDAGEDALNDAIESIGLRIARNEYRQAEQFDVKARSALLRMWLVLREDKAEQLRSFHQEHEGTMGFSKRATFITQHMDLKIVSSARGYAYQSLVVGTESVARQKIIEKGWRISSESKIGHEFFINLLFTFDEFKASQKRDYLDDKFSVLLCAEIRKYSGRLNRGGVIERRTINNYTGISGNGKEYSFIDKIPDSGASLPEDEAIGREEREEREDKLRKITKALELYIEQAKDDQSRAHRLKYVEIFQAYWGVGDGVCNQFGTMKAIAHNEKCSSKEAERMLRNQIAKHYGITMRQVYHMKEHVQEFIKSIVSSASGGPTEDRINETPEEAGDPWEIADALTDFISTGDRTAAKNRGKYVQAYLLSTELPIKLASFGGSLRAIVVPEEANNKKRLEAEAIAEEIGTRVPDIKRAINRVAQHVERYQENLTKSQNSLIADPDASQH
jgi:hypothetical protein